MVQTGLAAGWYAAAWIPAFPLVYLLNLFCCKADRAARLAEQGFLFGPRLPNASGATQPSPTAARQLADDLTRLRSST